ncbi:hypothetical protein HQO90_16885 [Rhodococcus fascians]|nr:hypothetical protein [Rhodococcus fascians]MBY4056919.1 hypothetical protein [Rhodococcus fascians]MBY4068302.1 hypothetical protein [Rhodococcus fascians]
MADRGAVAGLAGPIVLLYLGYFASVPTLSSLIHGIYDPRIDWADTGFGEVLLFSFLVVGGLAACVAAVRALADSPRFPGIVVTPGSSIGRKVDAVVVTLIAYAVVVLVFVTATASAGFLVPLIAAWACSNTIRNYRELMSRRRASAT